MQRCIITSNHVVFENMHGACGYLVIITEINMAATSTDSESNSKVLLLCIHNYNSRSSITASVMLKLS